MSASQGPAADADRRALLFASLSGHFDPRKALEPFATPGDVSRLLQAATKLATVCDTRPASSEGFWLMRTPARRSILRAMSRQELVEAVNERRKVEVDPETCDLLGALMDQSPLDRASIDSIIREANNQRALERVILALDWAGEVAPAFGHLPAARFALADLQRAVSRQRVVERGFFGRIVELGKIKNWLSFPMVKGPVSCLLLHGTAGIGKSTLMAEAVRRFCEDKRPITLRLDFDRAGLDVMDQVGLTMEATRQLAEQLGAAGVELLNDRLQAGHVSERSPRSQLSIRQRLPEPLAKKLGKAVSDSDRPVLVVLDTLEVLRGRGEIHPQMLFEWLDELVTRGVRPMHVLAAGRGDALDGLKRLSGRAFPQSPPNVPAERFEPYELAGLEDEAARSFLSKLGAPESLHDELIAIAQGNPLKLRLAAELSKRAGLEGLSSRRRDKEVSAAFLYRLLLSRIEDPDLKRLAHPGLIVRRISAELICDVLAPVLGLGSIDLVRANDLLQRLSTHHWLVEPDPGAPGFLKHRSDMRGLLLPLLYQSAPKQSARIDARALRWFAALPQSWAQVEAVYHQLQLTRVGPMPATIALHEASLIDRETLEELPRAAADLVRAVRGERTSQFREPRPGGGMQIDDALVTREVVAIIDRQDWKEGSLLVNRILEDGGLEIRSKAADAVRAFLWRSGQWARARDLLTERDRFTDSDDDLEDLPDQLALARLEMRAELDPESLRRNLRSKRARLLWLDRASLASKDNVARYGALSHILTSLEAVRFSADSLDEGDLIPTAQQYWTDDSRDDHQIQLIEQRARSRIKAIVPDPTVNMPFGRTVAALTPYATTLEILASHSPLPFRQWAGSVVEICVAPWFGGSLFGERWVASPAQPQDESVRYLANLGVFSEWLEVVAFKERDENLRLIARSAERWRRTVAGDWSYGRRQGAWRRLSLIDETVRWRLTTFTETTDPIEPASEVLRRWEAVLQVESLGELLRARFRATFAETSKLSSDPNALEAITRRLLARGVPTVFAPALAVLILHRVI